jgi:hypothetical protein
MRDCSQVEADLDATQEEPGRPASNVAKKNHGDVMQVTLREAT